MQEEWKRVSARESVQLVCMKGTARCHSQSHTRAPTHTHTHAKSKPSNHSLICHTLTVSSRNQTVKERERETFTKKKNFDREVHTYCEDDARQELLCFVYTKSRTFWGACLMVYVCVGVCEMLVYITTNFYIPYCCHCLTVSICEMQNEDVCFNVCLSLGQE